MNKWCLIPAIFYFFNMAYAEETSCNNYDKSSVSYNICQDLMAITTNKKQTFKDDFTKTLTDNIAKSTRQLPFSAAPPKTPASEGIQQLAPPPTNSHIPKHPPTIRYY